MSLLEIAKQGALHIADDISKKQNAISNQLRQLDELKKAIETTIGGTATGNDKKIIEIISAATKKGENAQAKLIEASTHMKRWENGSDFGGKPDDFFIDSRGFPSIVSNASAVQKEHRSFIASREECIFTIMKDALDGSGKQITSTQAATMYEAIQSFTGLFDYPYIRAAYNNPHSEQRDKDALNNLDSYLHCVPKWDGKIFRGIDVDERTAQKILSNDTVDMLGPASWSSEESVAQRFSQIKGNDVHMIFVLGENRSGSSITHIGSLNGIESEILAPSGIIYKIENYYRKSYNNKKFVYVYVHEQV